MRLIDYEPGAEDRALAAAGVRFCGWSLEEAAPGSATPHPKSG